MKNIVKIFSIAYLLLLVAAFFMPSVSTTITDAASLLSMAGVAVIFRPSQIDISIPQNWYVETPIYTATINESGNKINIDLILDSDEDYEDVTATLLYAENQEDNPNSLTIVPTDASSTSSGFVITLADTANFSDFLSIIQTYEFLNIQFANQSGESIKGLLQIEKEEK